MVQTNQEMERELPFFKWCFGLVFRRQDDKGPVVVLEGGWKLRCESLASLRYFLHGLAERVGDIVQVVTWCRPFFKWCFGLVFRRQDDKGPVVVLEGGWKLRCESLASLRYFLHGLAERVGDIVQVVNGADKPRNGVGTTLPRGGVFVLFVKDKLTEDMCGCFVLSQGRASSETPEAASSDVEPGQGQF